MTTRSNMPQLLSRDRFNEQVFSRSKLKCVFCMRPAADAHHIMERKLFPDQGYYLDNGAAVCHPHHYDCEITKISTEEVRAAAGIKTVILPPGFDPSLRYDKWGNQLRGDGFIMAGPLVGDDGCRKALQHGRKLQWLVYTDDGL